MSLVDSLGSEKRCSLVLALMVLATDNRPKGTVSSHGSCLTTAT